MQQLLASLTNCNWLCFIGAATLFYYVAKVLGFIYQYYLMSANVSKYKKAGSWAIVTGGGDGIGKAMSIEWAKRGFNVCLIGRTKAKLEEVAKLVEDRKVQSKCVQFDFSTADDAAYAKLFKELNQLDIGVLVNNVGINYDYPLEINEAEVELDMKILKVNCESQIRMIKFVVPRMKEKKAGAILNLSSASCRTATPMLSLYAGTKCFNKVYSESLAVELKPYGIDVTAVTPAMVCSNMSKRKKPTFDCPSAAAMAHLTVKQMGVPLTWGHRHHGIIGAAMESLPKFWLDGYMLGMNKKVQKAARRKAAKEAEAAAASK